MSSLRNVIEPPAPVRRTGPLLRHLEARSQTDPGAYRRSGGFQALESWRRRNRASLLEELDAAGVRGRAGGAFPTAQKWFQVARKDADSKYFVVNANTGEGDLKTPYLLRLSPLAVLEATLLAAHAVGAREAHLAVPASLHEERSILTGALEELPPEVLGGIELRVREIPDIYIVGEETALLEALEGKKPRPRAKPPMPTARGLFSAPTVVNNLETVLQAFLALALGADEYRSTGEPHAPGTLIFSLVGDVDHPGLYELPLGTPLRELVKTLGGATDPKIILPGGRSSPALAGSHLDLPLDPDRLRDAGSDLGSGSVWVFGADTSAVQLARELAEFFHRASCGKCQPCHDGTRRTALMLENLARLDDPAVDLQDRQRPDSKRRNALRIVGQDDVPEAAAISYTDNAQGLDKIRILSRFFSSRGDCHHSHEAAASILRLLDLFEEEFIAELAPPKTGGLERKDISETTR